MFTNLNLRSGRNGRDRRHHSRRPSHNTSTLQHEPYFYINFEILNIINRKFEPKKGEKKRDSVDYIIQNTCEAGCCYTPCGFAFNFLGWEWDGGRVGEGETVTEIPSLKIAAKKSVFYEICSSTCSPLSPPPLRSRHHFFTIPTRRLNSTFDRYKMPAAV